MLVIVCYIFYDDVTSGQSSLNFAVGPDTREGCMLRWGLTPARGVVWVTIIVTSPVSVHRRPASEPSCCYQRERQLLPTATM